VNQLIRIPDPIETWKSPSRNIWLRRIIVSAVLLLSTILAFQTSVNGLLRVLLVIMGLSGLVILLSWPSLGLLSILVSAFFIPYNGPGGINATFLLATVMVGIWVIDMIVKQKKITFVDRRTSIAIFFFIFSAILSYGIGQLSWFALARHAPLTAQTGGFGIYVLSGLIFLVVANLMRDLRWLKAFTWIFLAISVIYISGRMVPVWGHFLRRFFVPGAVTGSMFWIWMLIIPFSQALLNRKLHIFIRAMLLAFTALVLYVAVIQTNDWKSGYLPPLAGAAVIVALILKKRVVWFIPLGLAVAYYASTQAISTDAYSYVTRMEAWALIFKLSLVNPILGLGFGNYYHYTPLVAISGYHVSFNAHSQYLDILAQTGIIGVLTFAWVFWEIGKLGWRLHDRAPEGFARAYVYGALGGLVAMLAAGALVDWVLPFVYNIGMDGFRSSILGWMFLGGLVVINRIVEEQDKANKVLRP
jgi:hypothetical protein